MPELNTNSINSQADNAATDYATAVVTFYDGTPPASINDPLSGNNVLVAHTFTGFAGAANGIAVANAISDETILATGTATFARVVLGLNAMQLTVGLAADIPTPDVIVSSTSFLAGVNSKFNSAQIVQPAS